MRPDWFLPCFHRGEVLREVPCQLCGGRDRLIPIFACDLYGECALARTKSGTHGEYRQCLTCADRTPDHG